MKCTICKKEINTLFLGKIEGTYVKDKVGKRKAVCNECQKNNSLDAIKAKI
jgi:hypothetical protein